MKVFSRGHINLGWIFGIKDDLPVGYDKLEPVVRITSPEPKEKIEALMEKVMSHCPIVTNMGGASPIKPRIQIKPAE